MENIDENKIKKANAKSTLGLVLALFSLAVLIVSFFIHDLSGNAGICAVFAGFAFSLVRIAENQGSINLNIIKTTRIISLTVLAISIILVFLQFIILYTGK